MRTEQLFKVGHTGRPAATWADAVVGVGVLGLAWAAVYLSVDAPAVVRGPEISLSPAALPWYTGLSLARMTAAYALSLAFSLAFGYAAAASRRAERVLLPLLDVLQSVPLLSFLPAVLLSLSAFLPKNLAAEAASVILIFTCVAWNIALAWYQALTTIPLELRQANSVFRFNAWMRLRNVQLPFAAVSLIWNTVLSWAGGWFFLMAAETFTVGDRDFRLPGLGAYLQEAAARGDLRAVSLGLVTLVLVIAAIDQLVWRPLLAWSNRFKIEMVETESPPTSWFYDVLRNSALIELLVTRLLHPTIEIVDRWMLRHFPVKDEFPSKRESGPWVGLLLGIPAGVAAAYVLYRVGAATLMVSTNQWLTVGAGLGSTFLRVAVSLVIALAWTIPVGVLIGLNPRLAAWLQPLVQITASVPATALFPVFLLLLIGLPGGLNAAAVLLMLMGTQWYLLFNVIAGASAIAQDLKDTAVLLQLNRRQKWRTLILPALFPYIVTGAMAASGGAWNASIVAEYQKFGGKILQTTGIGALIADAGAKGDYRMLLASTLSLIVTVVLINRFVWGRLYRLAEDKYKLE